MKSVKKLMLVVALFSLVNLSRAESTRESSTDRLDNAGKVMNEIMAALDNGIPAEVLEHAKCVAVVSNMIKGGFVFGAQNGRGVATCRTAAGWSAQAFLAITGGSWGLQIGFEGVDLVMVVEK
ncbi:MAG TPA: lipid-binding SYLF domain-containing protein [Edaphobacter sp.]|nr:lipid-binding SYLF domain-containing protein [Edaphobacter sp.]